MTAALFFEETPVSTRSSVPDSCCFNLVLFNRSPYDRSASILIPLWRMRKNNTVMKKFPCLAEADELAACPETAFTARMFFTQRGARSISLTFLAKTEIASRSAFFEGISQLCFHGRCEQSPVAVYDRLFHNT